jgi:hypothetical protein
MTKSSPYIISSLVFALIAGCRETEPNGIATGPSTATAPSSLVGFAKRPISSPKHASPAMESVIDVLRSAPIVERYRIAPTQGEPSTDAVVGYRIIARGPALDEATALQLAKLVVDPRCFHGELWCGEIEPGVAFRFVGKSHNLTILVCFKCQEWEFWLDGERLGIGTFFGVQPELLALVQRLFPADESLRAIQPSEVYGRVYAIQALDAIPKSDPQLRTKALDERTTKIMNAVGQPAEWIDNGGSKYWLREIEDQRGVNVITDAKGHAAILALDGISILHQ